MKDRNTYRSQFAAYFTGKLSADETAAFEQALARDAKLAREAEAVRPVMDAMAQAADDNVAEFRLSADRLALIRAAASKQIVEFPKMAAASRRDVSLWRKLGPALAATVAVVIGAVSGFSSGRGSFDGSIASFQVATEVETADNAASTDEAVHYYPPAYGLDHYTDWEQAPAWHATGIGIGVGFASTTPNFYGLPGPRPPYVASGNSLFLQ